MVNASYYESEIQILQQRAEETKARQQKLIQQQLLARSRGETGRDIDLQRQITATGRLYEDITRNQIPMIQRTAGGLKPRGDSPKVQLARNIQTPQKVQTLPGTNKQTRANLTPTQGYVIKGRAKQTIRGELNYYQQFPEQKPSEQKTKTLSTRQMFGTGLPPPDYAYTFGYNKPLPIQKEKITPAKSLTEASGMNNAIIGKREQFTTPAITSIEQYEKLQEKKQAPIRSAIFQPIEKALETTRKKTVEKTGVIAPTLLFGLGFISGTIDLTKSTFHPVKTVKQTVYGLFHPREAFSALGERIETKGLTYVGGEIFGFAKSGGWLTNLGIKGTKTATKIAKQKYIEYNPPKILTAKNPKTIGKTTSPKTSMAKSQTTSTFERKPTKSDVFTKSLGEGSKTNDLTFAGKPPKNPKKSWGKKAQLTLQKPKLSGETPSQIKTIYDTPSKIKGNLPSLTSFGLPETIFGTIFILKQRGKQTGKNPFKQISISKPETVTKLKINPDIADDLLQQPDQDVGTIPKQTTSSKLIILPRLTPKLKQDFFNTEKTPETERGGDTFFNLPFSPPGGSKNKKGRQPWLITGKRQYEPTLYATAFNITGKQPKGLLSGLGIRPLPEKKTKRKKGKKKTYNMVGIQSRGYRPWN